MSEPSGELLSWLPTTVVWDSQERRLLVDWWRPQLREPRWLQLSVEESVRVSLEMDGSRPETETRISGAC